jgi:Protein of unknown function (DUF962)
MHEFLRALEEQRWDDHRYYHHNRINQSLHVVSALSFLSSYVLLFTSPVAAAVVGWTLAMVSRQIGHFFFEPKGYDELNHATNEYKEKIKVGYNLRRKQVLLSIWALTPLLLLIDPTVFGHFEPRPGFASFMERTARLWLWLGGAALTFRVVQLWFVRDFQTGIVWAVKILTDPFHDIKLYHRAPLQVLRGELLEPLPAAGQDGQHSLHGLDEFDGLDGMDARSSR